MKMHVTKENQFKGTIEGIEFRNETLFNDALEALTYIHNTLHLLPTKELVQRLKELLETDSELTDNWDFALERVYEITQEIETFGECSTFEFLDHLEYYFKHFANLLFKEWSVKDLRVMYRLIDNLIEGADPSSVLAELLKYEVDSNGDNEYIHYLYAKDMFSGGDLTHYLEEGLVHVIHPNLIQDYLKESKKENFDSTYFEWSTTSFRKVDTELAIAVITDIIEDLKK